MRKSQTSTTASGIAVLRAVESEKPAQERICNDPYARYFIPGWFYAMMKFFIRSGYAEWRGHGVIGFLVARDRYIDDYLDVCLHSQIDQIILLGAGYDSRAYRFDGFKEKTRVFEVDHPATQQLKIKKVKQIFGDLPSHVTYVAIDFNNQDLRERLAAHGYDPALRSLFIWQGVTYYLDAGAVEGTLAFISRQAAPGSSVIFDYVDEDLLISPGNHGEVRGMKRYRGMTGEDLRFGIPQSRIQEYLSGFGFTQIQNVPSERLKELYFSGKNSNRNVMSGYAIVSAVVANPSET